MEQGENQDTNMVGMQLEERMKEVWSYNLEDEFKNICRIVNEYPYVAMDTEFPGVVARPIGEFKSIANYQYQLLRCNKKSVSDFLFKKIPHQMQCRPPENHTTGPYIL